MNVFYIEYMVKAQRKEEHEECRKRRLLQQYEGEELRSKIVASASSFFDQLGFEKTSIADICRDLDISKKNFHQHFKSLDEVLEVLWENE